METKKKNTGTIGGVVLVGCMLIGMGIGMLYNLTAIGIFIGLGAGFLGMGIVYAYYKNN